MCAYPGVDIRLVSARGQLYYTNLSWSDKVYYGANTPFNPVSTGNTDYSLRDCYCGVDLYTRPATDNGEGQLTYLCTINMDRDGSGGITRSYANVGGGPNATRAGHKIVSVTDRSSGASTAHNSTDIMKVTSSQQIIPVLWFEKPNVTDRIPKAGFLWFEAEIGYYEI